MAYCDPDIRVDDKNVEVSIDTSLPVFDDYKTAKYHKFTDFIIGEVFRKYSGTTGWTPSNLTNPYNIQKLTKGIYTYLENALIENANETDGSIFSKMSDEAYLDIENTILPNFEQFIGHYYRFNPIANTTDFALDDDFYANDYTDDKTSSEIDGVSPEETDDNQGKEYDRIGNEVSPVALAEKEVKLLFRLIPKAEWNEGKQKSEVFIDSDGLPTTADFGPTFNLLLDRMANTKDYDGFKSKLNSIDTLRVIPEAQYIAELIKVDKDDSSKSRNEALLFMKFYQIFSKPKVQIQSVIRQANGNTLIIDEVQGNLRSIRQNFVSNFQLGNVNDSVKQYLVKDDLNGYHLQKDKLPEKPTTYQDRIDFLSLLGIKFSGLKFLDTDSKTENFNSLLSETSDYLYDSVKNRLNAGEILREPVEDLRKQYTSENRLKIVKSEAASLDRIVAFESKYSKLVPSLSSRNSEGQLQYLISLDNQLTISTYHLNNSNTLDELYKTSTFVNAKYNPLFETSYTIRFLFDKNGNKIEGRTVDMTNLSGYKKQIGKRIVSKLERKLSPKDKMIQDFPMMLVDGKTDVMRTETSHSFFAISLKENGKNRNYFATNGFITDFKSNSAFRATIYNYLKAEIDRVNSYREKLAENPTIPTSYGKFSIFDNILESGNTVLRDKLLKEKFDKDSQTFTDFMNLYEQSLNQNVQNYKDQMDKLGVSFDDILSTNLKNNANNTALTDDAYVRAFIANTMIQNIEFSIAYSGDPLFVKDFHKRLKGLSSTGDLASTISLLSDFRNSSYEKGFYDKYSIAGGANIKQRNNDKNFQTQTLLEYKQKSDFAYTHPDIVTNIRESIILRDKINEQFTEDYIKNKVLDEAHKQKPADGQGYVGLDFHRELSYRFGFNTDEMEAAYKYEGLVFRRDILEQELSKEDSDELDNIERQIFANPDKYAIPVIKMTYYGNVENSTVDAKAYDKFSTAPLLPSDVKNNPILKKLLLDMTKKQLGYVKYQSATKMFATTPVNIDSITDAKHDLYQTELLKLQIKPKSKQGKTTSIPTQMLKLVFSNLFNSAKSSEAVHSLYNDYVNNLKGIQKVQTENLLKSMGITDGNIDINLLSQRLIQQAKSQGLNSNVINALTVKNGALNGALEESGFVEQIINLVSGLSDSTLRRFELAGGDYVLITNANRGKLNFYNYSSTGTKACDCRITMGKEHVKLLNAKHPDGEIIGTLERMNQLLNDQNWRDTHEKELMIVLDRVPTQGPNSMDYAVAREFLSPTMGNAIILPDEIVYKSGTDFDYDKEKVLTPKFTNDGQYISESNMESLKKQVGELEAEYSELRDFVEDYDDSTLDNVNNLVNRIFNNSFERGTVPETLDQINEKVQNYLSMKNAEFSKLNNSIIETYNKALSLPEMFAELVIPNSTRTLKPLAERNATIAGIDVSLPSGSNVFNYLDNLKVFSTYFDAKNMLGPFAVDNTFMQLLQYQGIDINDSYLRYGNIKQPRTITNFLLDEYEQSRIKNGNKFRTSLRDDLNNYIKQHWDSEAINATVDAAKDPWFALLRINYQNIGVVNFMKNLGYPIERIIDFINLPVLQNYFVLQQNGMTKNKAIQLTARNLGIISEKTDTVSVPEQQYNIMKNDPNITIQSASMNSNGKYIVKSTTPTDLKIGMLTTVLRGIDENKKLKSTFKAISDKLTYERITPEILTSKITEPIQSDDFNIRAFAHFVMMDQHNQAFRNFQYYFNFDTTKMATPTDIKDKENLRDTLVKEGMFSLEDIQKMENNSIMSSFINNKTIKSIFDGLFPIIGREDVQDTLDSLYKSYKINFSIRNQNDLRNMPKVLNNDLITSILFNFNIENGVSFIDRNKHLIIREEDKQTMGDQLEQFKKESFYNNLVKTFPVLDQFIVSKHRINFLGDKNGLKQYSFIENIQMLKPTSETVVETESIIEQLKNLSSYTIKNYSEEQNEEFSKNIQDFAKNLFTTGLVQSGMGTSYVGYSEYIPTDFKRSLFSNALENFKNIPDEDFANFLAKFQSQFTYNNPKYFPEVKSGGESYVNQNNYSSLFKNYNIDLGYSVYGDDTEDETQTDDEPEIKKEPLQISEVKRSSKKESFTIKMRDGTEETLAGYVLSIPEYPDFKAFISGSSKDGWSITESTTGMSIQVNGNTIKDILPELKELLNRNLGSETAKKIGLIEPDNLPPIEPDCPF